MAAHDVNVETEQGWETVAAVHRVTFDEHRLTLTVFDAVSEVEFERTCPRERVLSWSHTPVASGL